MLGKHSVLKEWSSIGAGCPRELLVAFRKCELNLPVEGVPVHCRGVGQESFEHPFQLRAVCDTGNTNCSKQSVSL